MPAARTAGPFALTLLLAALAALAACSAAQPQPSDAATRLYLALGDSLAVGVGADESGYVARLFAALHDDGQADAVRNVARSGETSGSLIHGGQLREAVDAVADPSTDVVSVTLDIGGNDLLRLRRSADCAADPTGARCARAVAAALREYRANYRHILGELRLALDEDAGDEQLLVMTYYSPYRGTGSAYEEAADHALLGSDATVDCDRSDEAGVGLNDLIACSDDPGVTIVDTYPLFGHATALTHISANDVHPNDAGYALIADAFLDAVRSRTVDR